MSINVFTETQQFASRVPIPIAAEWRTGYKSVNEQASAAGFAKGIIDLNNGQPH